MTVDSTHILNLNPSSNVNIGGNTATIWPGAIYPQRINCGASSKDGVTQQYFGVELKLPTQLPNWPQDSVNIADADKANLNALPNDIMIGEYAGGQRQDHQYVVLSSLGQAVAETDWHDGAHVQNPKGPFVIFRVKKPRDVGKESGNVHAGKYAMGQAANCEIVCTFASK